MGGQHPGGHGCPGSQVIGAEQLVAATLGSRPLKLHRRLAGNGCPSKYELGGGIGRVGSRNELCVVGHAVAVAIHQLRMVGSDRAEIVFFPGIGDAVVIGVNKGVVTSELCSAPGGN